MRLSSRPRPAVAGPEAHLCEWVVVRIVARKGAPVHLTKRLPLAEASAEADRRNDAAAAEGSADLCTVVRRAAHSYVCRHCEARERGHQRRRHCGAPMLSESQPRLDRRAA